MSLEDVKAFYQRLGTDEAFRTQIQGVNSKDECSQIVKSAGYDFTQEELEEYTAELLELSADEDGLADLDETELATIFGGIGAQQLSEPSNKRLSIQEFIKNRPMINLLTNLPPELRDHLIVPSYGIVIWPGLTSETLIAQPFMPLPENFKEV